MIDDELKDIKTEVKHPFDVTKETDFKADFLPCPFCGGENIKVVEEFFLSTDPIGAYCVCEDCKSKIALCWDKTYAVKVWNTRAEPKKGEWIESNRRPRSGTFYCSVCHREAYDPQPTRLDGWVKRCRYKFCPNCGAEMRGEQ